MTHFRGSHINFPCPDMGLEPRPPWPLCLAIRCSSDWAIQAYTFVVVRNFYCYLGLSRVIEVLFFCNSSRWLHTFSFLVQIFLYLSCWTFHPMKLHQGCYVINTTLKAKTQGNFSFCPYIFWVEPLLGLSPTPGTWNGEHFTQWNCIKVAM